MLLIHDLEKNIEKDILPSLPSDIKIFSKEINNIHPCCGCFNCWIKTPGRCIINDDFTELPKYILENDLYVTISKIQYGCYSPYIKNVIDRSIGFLLPFLKIVNKEIHHSLRYDTTPRLVFIGYDDDVTVEEEHTFKELVQANAINYGNNKFEVYIAKNISDIQNILKNL